MTPVGTSGQRPGRSPARMEGEVGVAVTNDEGGRPQRLSVITRRAGDHGDDVDLAVAVHVRGGTCAEGTGEPLFGVNVPSVF